MSYFINKKFLIPFFVSLFLISYYLIFKINISSSEKELEFTIDKPYLFVTKNLVTKNSLEKIVEENNGVVVNKNWENFTVEVPKRIFKLKDYKIDANLKFKVIKNDKDLGELKLSFEQVVKIDDENLLLNIKLSEPNDKVLYYEKNVDISKINEESSLVKIKSNLKIKKNIPFFFKNYMDKRVDDLNGIDINQMKQNIIKIINSDSVVNFKRQSR